MSDPLDYCVCLIRAVALSCSLLSLEKLNACLVTISFRIVLICLGQGDKRTKCAKPKCEFPKSTSGSFECMALC